MVDATNPQSRTPYVVATIITLVLLFIFLLVVLATHRNQSWIFAPYQSQPGSGLTTFIPDSHFVPPTPEQAQKRLQMICDSWDSLNDASGYRAGPKPSACPNTLGVTTGYLPNL
jgi:hypothetical protein